MKPLAERHTHTHKHTTTTASDQHLHNTSDVGISVFILYASHKHNTAATMPKIPSESLAHRHRQSPRILRLGIRAKFHLIHEGSKIITPREKRKRDKKKSRGWRIWEEGKTGKKGEMRRRNYILGCLQVSQVK